MSLLQFMADEGLVPCPEEETRRSNVVEKLKEIVLEWAKRVAFQRRLSKSSIKVASATIMTYGSYGLGVHDSDSDIDALCVGPNFATMAEDFFIVLRNMILSRPEVVDLLCVKNAKVPLMRFTFDGISIDLPYSKLNTVSIPENVNVMDPFFFVNVDEISWRNLSGVRANQSILQLVPNLQLYQSLLRCFKFWAKRRGIYGNLFGFFGGVHLAALGAYVYIKQPEAQLSTLVSIFFHTFAFWPWPTPVILEDGLVNPNKIPVERSLMPIQLPCSPNEYCNSNIARSTFYRIRAEFLHAHSLTKDILLPDFSWKILFEPFSYAKNYSRFLKICLSSPQLAELGDWVGLVKSRIRYLLNKLEDLHGFCDPNPTEYVDLDIPEPNVVFYWGLKLAGRNNNINVEHIKADFMDNVHSRHEVRIGKMELTVIKASELPVVMSKTGNKFTKASWRIPDSNEEKIPMYSKHMPGHLVGYLAIN